MVQIRPLYMLMMLIYGVKAYTPQALLVSCKESVLGANVQKFKYRVFHDFRA